MAAKGTLGRLAYMDGLRALAALYVVVCHVTLTVWPGGFADSAIPFYAHVWLYGHQVVAAFIVLSGYSLMLPIVSNGYRLPHGALTFYKRRARRIIPPYYASMALALALIWLAIGGATATVWRQSLPVSWPTILTHLALIQELYAPPGAGQVNYVYWSIALECQIYLLFPLLLVAWRRWKPLAAAALIMLLSLVLSAMLILALVDVLHGYYPWGFALWFVGPFALGMLAATYRARRWSRYVGVLTLLGGVLMAPWALSVNITIPSDTAAALITAGLLLLAGAGARVVSWLSWRPLVWVGGFSYSIYLIHAPLLQLIWQCAIHPLGLGDGATFLTLLLVGLPVILVCAWIFWYVAERPFMTQHQGRQQMHSQVERAFQNTVSLEI